jgi:hypothetical protein
MPCPVVNGKCRGGEVAPGVRQAAAAVCQRASVAQERPFLPTVPAEHRGWGLGGRATGAWLHDEANQKG